MSLQGYTGTANINGDVVCVKRANANETCDDLDTTSTCAEVDGITGSAYETRMNGTKRIEITLEADYPTGSQGSPPIIEVGEVDVAIVLDVGYTITGIFLAAAFTYSFEVKGLIGYSGTFKSTGAYTVG